MFEDWVVGCDNGLRCKAVSLQPTVASDSSDLSIERGAGPDDKPVLMLDLRSDSKAAAIWFDRTKVPIRVASATGAIFGVDTLQLTRLVQKATTIRLADESGQVISTISALGASAALRWLDERQGRVGSTSAIVAVGSRLSGKAPPTLPTIRPAKPSSAAFKSLGARQVSAIRAKDDCFDADDRPVRYHRLDSTTTLALVPCLVGAYQVTSIVALVSNSGRSRLAPLEFSDEPSTLIDAEFLQDKRVLWSSFKGRGIGDCGGTDKYLWDGVRFRLAYRDRMDECRGTADRIPIWRTTNETTAR
jgi:hypothetical protein